MFASQAHLFQDELESLRNEVPAKPLAGKSGKGLSARGTYSSQQLSAKNEKSGSQTTKPKRRCAFVLPSLTRN